MNTLAFVLSIVIALSLTVTDKAVVANPPKSIQTPKAESPLRCGGILNDASGGISYKPYESILPNERCAWTIQSGSAEGFNINVLRIGTEEGTEVQATCVKGPWAAWSYPITTAGQFNSTKTECPVVVITLWSLAGSQNSKGFILEYEAIESSGSPKISPTSRQQITNADIGHIRYPDNFFVARKNTTLTFVEDWMDDVHCYDTIHVFHLVESVTGTRRVWKWASAVCPGTGMMVLSNHDDLILVVFLTDERRTGSGFHLIHSRSQW